MKEWRDYMAEPKSPAEEILAKALDPYSYDRGTIPIADLCATICRAMEEAIRIEVRKQLGGM